MLIGYNSLSNHDCSSEQQQIEQLKQAGCQKIYASLALALDSLNRNDILVVANLKILAQSKFSLLQTFDLLQEKSAYLQSLEDDYLFSSFSLHKNNLISEHQAGLEPSLSRPKSSKHKRKKGRPAISAEQKELIYLLRTNYPDMSITKICKLTNICRQSYYNLFPKSA